MWCISPHPRLSQSHVAFLYHFTFSNKDHGVGIVFGNEGWMGQGRAIRGENWYNCNWTTIKILKNHYLSYYIICIFSILIFVFLFIVVQLQLSHLFPHCSTLSLSPTPTVNPPIVCAHESYYFSLFFPSHWF